jgi:hypothetical protein
VTRTSGTGEYLNLSWTEYDPDDVLGLPGNVHIGYLYLDRGPYGTYFYGNVTDFDCDEGETPYGGGHGVVVGLVEDVVDTGGDTSTDATEDALQAIADSGATAVDAAEVVDSVKAELAEAVTDVIADEFEEVPACDYIQDRFLEGDGTVEVSIDTKIAVAHVTGSVTVTSGGHGTPGGVLATPPVDITISGGEWQRYEYSSSAKGESYSYSYWQEGTSWNGGTVSGGIGAMGFDDDPDDESFADFSSYRYRTVDRVR